MKSLAIIPARSGSKGIPGKNKMHFDGKPLISYSIETAIQSKLITDIIVSTDCPEISNIASKFDGIKLHNRHKNLSSDESPIIETIIQIINSLNYLPDFVVLLQPTSPTRTASEVDEALTIIQSKTEIKSVVSVIRMDDIHPARMYWMSSVCNKMDSILTNYESTRRQEIPPAFYRNGSIYIARAKDILKERSMFISPTYGYEMSNQFWLNIDDKRDVIIAESILKAWKKNLLS